MGNNEVTVTILLENFLVILERMGEVQYDRTVPPMSSDYQTVCREVRQQLARITATTATTSKPTAQPPVLVCYPSLPCMARWG